MCYKTFTNCLNTCMNHSKASFKTVYKYVQRIKFDGKFVTQVPLARFITGAFSCVLQHSSGEEVFLGCHESNEKVSISKYFFNKDNTYNL